LIRSINISVIDGKPVTRPVITVAELAAQLQSMIADGHGNLPVFASDGRGRYPFQTFVPLNRAGYHDCLLIQPQPHLHVEEKPVGLKPEGYFREVNEEADGVRKACGAFA
jgi:hypothetical protein